MDERAALQQAAQQPLAPALLAFTQWVLGRALEDGVARLYFLARDGWHPWRLASRLCRAWGLPVECRYLYGSRYAWRLPLCHRDVPLALSRLCVKGQGVTLGGVLAQAGLSPREQGAVSQALALPLGRRLSERDRRALAGELARCPAFLHPMEERSRRALPALAGYLRQEGLLGPVPWALVDSGWMGSTQETLGEALSLLGWQGQLQGYYAGLYRAPAQGRWDCFFFRPGRDLPVQAGFEPSLFEAAFCAPHGMTTGYRWLEGRFFPLLGPPPAGAGKLSLLGEVFQRRGEELAAEEPPRDLLWQGLRQRPAAWEGLGQLMARPTREQAAALGSLPFSDHPLERGARPLAPPLAARELARCRLLPRLLLGPPEAASAWLPGSAAGLSRPEGWFGAFDRLRWARVLALAGRAAKSTRG